MTSPLATTSLAVRQCTRQGHGIVLRARVGGRDIWDTFDDETAARRWLAQHKFGGDGAKRVAWTLEELLHPRSIAYQRIKRPGLSPLELEGIEARALSAPHGLWVEVDRSLALGLHTYTEKERNMWARPETVPAPRNLVGRLMRAHYLQPAGYELAGVEGRPLNMDAKHPGWHGEARYISRDATHPPIQVRWRLQVLSLQLVAWCEPTRNGGRSATKPTGTPGNNIAGWNNTAGGSRSPIAPGYADQRLVAQVRREHLPRGAHRHL